MDRGSSVPAPDPVLGALLAKAEEIASQHPADAADVCVVWDPVQSRAVRLLSEEGGWLRPLLLLEGPLPKAVFAAMYAAEATAWATPQPPAQFVPSRIVRSDAFGVAAMPSWERAGLVRSCHVRDDRRFGHVVVYVMSCALRVEDNRALQYAHRLARESGLGLVVLAFAEVLGVPLASRGGEWRLHCLASVAAALGALHVPLVCFAGAFGCDPVLSFARERAAHVLVCDWHPGAQDEVASLVEAELCPVLCFDSSSWVLRDASASVDSVEERCAQLMRDSALVRPLPSLAPLPRTVQDTLRSPDGNVFVPASVVRRLQVLPPAPWRAGIEAARAELERCRAFLVEHSRDWREERAREIRDMVGAWMMLPHIEGGAIAPVGCLRTWPSGVEARQRRVALEVLVWAREQRMLWWGQQIAQQQPQPSVGDIVDGPMLDPLAAAIHARLEQTGLIHPLLLRHWLAGLDSEARLVRAKAHLSRLGCTGWSYALECAVRFELQTSDSSALVASHRENLVSLLRHAL